MASTYNFVVVGASFGGLPVAHGLLKEVIPLLGSETSYKVTLINPTNEFLWKIGTPRVVAKPDGLPLEKALLDFLPTFSKYGNKFEFIQAYASSIDPSAQTVSLSTGSSVHYDSLIIASGTNFSSDLWSTTAGSDKVRAAYKEVHDKLPGAKSILVAGGGAAGVETAGEFGEQYGKAKEVVLLSGSTGLLSRLENKSVGKDAQSRLESYGVKVINDSIRVSEDRVEGDKHVLTLSNGEIKTVDIYVNATGDKPNSDFVPASWLDEKKKVKTDEHTLRLDVPGTKNVYAIGSVTSFSDGSIMDSKFAVKPLLYSIQVDLKGTESGPRTKNIYKKFTKDMQMVPVGSTGGVGTAMGWRMPSLMIRFVKSRDFMIGNAAKLIEGQA